MSTEERQKIADALGFMSADEVTDDHVAKWRTVHPASHTIDDPQVEETYTFKVLIVRSGKDWQSIYDALGEAFKLGGIRRWVSTGHAEGDTR